MEVGGLRMTRGLSVNGRHAQTMGFYLGGWVWNGVGQSQQYSCERRCWNGGRAAYVGDGRSRRGVEDWRETVANGGGEGWAYVCNVGDCATAVVNRLHTANGGESCCRNGSGTGWVRGSEGEGEGLDLSM